jgi:hypothetical protein
VWLIIALLTSSRNFANLISQIPELSVPTLRQQVTEKIHPPLGALPNWPEMAPTSFIRVVNYIVKVAVYRRAIFAVEM